MTLLGSWGRHTALAFAVSAIALALVLDDGGEPRAASSLTPGLDFYTPPLQPASAKGRPSSSGTAILFSRRGLSAPAPAPHQDANSSEVHAADHTTDNHAGHGDHGLLFASLIVGMGAILKFALDAVGNFFPLPYTVALVLLGGLLGCLNSVGECHFRTDVHVDVSLGGVNCSGLQHSRCANYEEQCYFESSLPSSLGLLGTSIDVWAQIDPHFLLFFFIPALVYASAQTVDVHIFRESLVNVRTRHFRHRSCYFCHQGLVLFFVFCCCFCSGHSRNKCPDRYTVMSSPDALTAQVVTLAIPGVLLATYLMFAFFYTTYGDNPRYGWSFDACMCFGSILAATDPVAVVALLDDLGAPHKLSIAIEGESLLNDGPCFKLWFCSMQKYDDR